MLHLRILTLPVCTNSIQYRFIRHQITNHLSACGYIQHELLCSSTAHFSSIQLYAVKNIRRSTDILWRVSILTTKYLQIYGYFLQCSLAPQVVTAYMCIGLQNWEQDATQLKRAMTYRQTICQAFFAV